MAIPVMRAVGLAPFVNFVTEASLIADLIQVGFDVLETGMYPERSRSLFIVAKRAS